MTYFTKTYDEAFINENSVRTNYKKFISWYKNQDNNELTKWNRMLALERYNNDDEDELVSE